MSYNFEDTQHFKSFTFNFSHWGRVFTIRNNSVAVAKAGTRVVFARKIERFPSMGPEI